MELKLKFVCVDRNQFGNIQIFSQFTQWNKSLKWGRLSYDKIQSINKAKFG